MDAFKNGVKTTLRTPGKSLLFSLILLLLALLAAVAFSVFFAVRGYLSDCEDYFHTIVHLEYIGKDYPMELRGIKGKPVREKAAQLLRRVDLPDELRSRFPGMLSGGEQQRVAIARALAKNPKLLLCDEPTGALDYITGKQILKLLQDTARQTGMTVVIITHNSALTAMADRVVRIRSGTVAEQYKNEQAVPVEQIEW